MRKYKNLTVQCGKHQYFKAPKNPPKRSAFCVTGIMLYLICQYHRDNTATSPIYR